METSNISKHEKDVNQSESPITGESELVDLYCENDPNANLGAEPNFNLNLNLTSPSNPRPSIETKKDEGNKKGENPGRKVAVITEVGKNSMKVMSPEQNNHSSLHKSKIPGLSRSPTAERPMNSRVEQKLKSPNPKHTPTLSPKMYTQSDITVSPKPQHQEQKTAINPATAEREKYHSAESVTNSKLYTAQTNAKTAKSVNKGPGQKLQSNRKEDEKSSGKLQTPKTLHVPVNIYNQMGDTKKTSPKPANRQTGKTPKPKAASPSVKSKQLVSHSPTTHNPQGSFVGQKPQNQKAEMTLLSAKTHQQSSPSPKPSTQRKVALIRKRTTSKTRSDSNSHPATRGIKDSLDSKSGSHLKASPSYKTTIGPRGSNISSISDSNNSLTHVTSKPALVASGINIDQVEPALLLISGFNNSKLFGPNTKSSPEPKEETDSFKLRTSSSSKSVVADLSPSLMPSPRQSSANSPSPGKCLGFVLSGPSREVLRSPGSAPGPGVGLSAPLASSSPKTKIISTTKAGCTQESTALSTMEPNSSTISHNTGFTRGLTFDSITKTSVKMCDVIEDQHSKLPETKVTVSSGSVESQSSPIQHPPVQSMHPSKPKRVKEPVTAKDTRDRPNRPKVEQREVGVQVEVEMVERSASTSPSFPLEAPTTSSITGSPSFQTDSLTSPMVPSLPPLQHVCRINLELSRQSEHPPLIPDKTGSLPASLRTYSFPHRPLLMSDLGLRHNPTKDVSIGSIWEADEEKQNEDGKTAKGHNKEGKVKLQDVAWDDQGMTWEVYGASVDPETLGTAIQSHLESKIRTREKHIRTLRRSICSDSSLRRKKMKKRKRRGGILGCCSKASSVAD